jgi:glucosamine-phosphate N-acetyltransferase
MSQVIDDQLLLAKSLKDTNLNEEDVLNNNHSLLDNDYLFDSQIFSKIESTFDDIQNSKGDKIKVEHTFGHSYEVNLGENLYLRSLRCSDFDRGYLQLLAQLTKVGDLKRQVFESKFKQMQSCYNTYYTFVIEDRQRNLIAASLTLVNEQKFIRNASSRGRVEDVVVDEYYRGKKLSKILLETALSVGKHIGCYKISLECNDKLVGLYGSFGFKHEESQNYLCKRFI